MPIETLLAIHPLVMLMYVYMYISFLNCLNFVYNVGTVFLDNYV